MTLTAVFAGYVYLHVQQSVQQNTSSASHSPCSQRTRSAFGRPVAGRRKYAEVGAEDDEGESDMDCLVDNVAHSVRGEAEEQYPGLEKY